MRPLDPFTVHPCEPERTYFRVLGSEEPDLHDFYSDEAAGKVGPDLQQVVSWAVIRGFSVRATLAQAISFARWLGRSHVAEISLDGEDGSAFARTGRTRGHHTIWAKADKVLAESIKAIHPVEERE